MKLKGNNISHLRDYEDMKINQDLTLRVYGLPWDFDDRLHRFVPVPEDQGDIRAVSEYGNLRMSATLWECLDPEEVDWETAPPEKEGKASMLAFYRSLYQEIEAFMTPRQGLAVVRKAVELSVVTAGDVDSARSDFLGDSPVQDQDQG